MIILVLSALQLAMGISIATSSDGPEQMRDLAQRYGAATSGKMIDRGVYGLLAAIALGALSEIGLSLKASAGSPKP